MGEKRKLEGGKKRQNMKRRERKLGKTRKGKGDREEKNERGEGRKHTFRENKSAMTSVTATEEN